MWIYSVGAWGPSHLLNAPPMLTVLCWLHFPLLSSVLSVMWEAGKPNTAPFG